MKTKINRYRNQKDLIINPINKAITKVKAIRINPSVKGFSINKNNILSVIDVQRTIKIIQNIV